MPLKRISWRSCFVLFVVVVGAIISALFYKQIMHTLVDDHKNATLQQVKTKQELRVGMLRSLTKFYVDYRNPNQVGGFDHALLKNFADHLGVKLTVIFANNTDELIAKFNEDKIDLISAELQASALESNPFVMSNSYHLYSQQLVYRKGSTKPYSIDQITGTLMVPKNSTQSHILGLLKNEAPNLNWQESSVFNQEELLKLVEDQTIDYTIADEQTVTIMQRIYPMLTVAFNVIDDQPKAWYFHDLYDDSLLKEANQFINDAISNGTVKNLEQRYFSYMDRFDYVDTRAFIRAIDTTLPKYRPFFEKYAKKNDLDWKFIAAMAYQESHWNPKAVSTTGVRGIMMLTKSTAESMGVTNRLNAEQSIKGGTAYIKQIIKRIPNTVPKEERVWFALAGYNMGLGHLWDARKLASEQGLNPDSWHDVRQVLPLLSEEEYYSQLKYGFARGFQASHFVDSVQQYYMSLVGYLLEKEHRHKHMQEKQQTLSPTTDTISLIK
ncbi:membrane-bound lytic murein transglycosylase MltF [Orbaceae bacterium ac157xtp]